MSKEYDEILKRFEQKGLVKGFKQMRNSSIDIKYIEDDLKKLCNLYILQERYNELLSFIYISDNVLNIDVQFLLLKLYDKRDYPSFLKQAYRFKYVAELEQEINNAINWHLEKKLPDSVAWRNKFDALKLELQDGSKNDGKPIYTINF